ncbi:PQQ-dependent sugar dehydrogenase [uncultured Marinobacter sp.]|uniref:PQQ-dependent sugar dehydrogenase n=1 Tax=uncultured Marinobacter sp. TaxID=187379 RepID=UPI00258BE4D1|nr:PQQ-dependent sugar dehydrogenase [uncultured Marinobacter sp.]
MKFAPTLIRIVISAIAGFFLTTSIYLYLQDGTIANLTSNQMFFLVAVGLSIISASIYLLIFDSIYNYVDMLKFISAFSVAFGAYAFILLYFDASFSARGFVIVSFLIAGTVFLFFISKPRVVKYLMVGVTLASLIFIVYPSGLFFGASGGEIGQGEDKKYVFSALHDIKIESLSMGESVTQDGGALAGATDSGLVLVTGRGEVLEYNISGERLPKLLFEIQFGLSKYKEASESPNRWYRITDAFIDHDYSDLLVTYTKWNSSEDCYTVNLESYKISLEDLSLQGSPETIYETTPCVGHKLLNNETGGRILKTTNSRIIFSIGSFKVSEKLSLNDYRKSSYGKVLEYNRSTGEVSVFSTGHRNAQGLTQCDDNIYLTEHGPYGGDELNLLIEGQDYGWPESSFGTDYGKKVLTISGETGQHLKGKKPIYAWIPAIGISNAICYQGDAFENWENDLLIASLNGLGSGYSIYRTRLFEGRVISIERINVGFKIRDLMELDDGRVLVWDGLNTISILSPATSEFASCSGCHNIRYRSHGIGPDLRGVVGAPIARHTDRYNYSDSLKSLSGSWTPERLHSFLKNPQEFAPGTTMDIQGIEDYDQRQKIIEYLEGVSNR